MFSRTAIHLAALSLELGSEDCAWISVLTIALNILEEIMDASPGESFGDLDFVREETHDEAFIFFGTECRVADASREPNIDGAISE
jgi:hypothetical protein